MRLKQPATPQFGSKLRGKIRFLSLKKSKIGLLKHPVSTAIVVIGNSAVKFYSVKGGKPVLAKIVPADVKQVKGHPFLKQAGLKAVIIASVVPSLSRAVKQAVKAKVIELKNGDVPLGNLYRKKSEAGIDRLLAAYAAKEKYGAPLLVIDFGTATTFNVVDGRGSFAGGMILPGFGVFTEYLSNRTAKLPRFAFKRPKELIGRDTKQNILSGTYSGAVVMAEGILAMLKENIKGRVKVIATGGFSGAAAKAIKGIDKTDNMLVASGALKAAGGRLKKI